MGKRSGRRRRQKNFLKVPEAILGKVQSLPEDQVVVATVVKIAATAIAGGEYSHLDMTLEGERPTFPSELVPKPTRGRYSRRNVEGKEVVRRDLPKVTKTFWVEGPNWGDWSKGSHVSPIPRQVYPRDFLPPKELVLRLELMIEQADEQGEFLFKVAVGEVLDRRAPNFEDDLLYDLNLLQENIGAIDVFTASASREEYLQTITVLWEILPPGTREEMIANVLSGVGTVRQEVRAKLESRFALLATLKPAKYIKGASGFRRYFGAYFNDNLVVFEHLEYGNALYIMDENWLTLSRLSRLELLSSARSGFERIIHRGQWEKRLAVLINSRRNPPAAAA